MPTPTPSGDAAHLQALLDDRLAEIRRQVTENRRVRAANDALRKDHEAAKDSLAWGELECRRYQLIIQRLDRALRDLADRCDRTPLADGSNIDTTAARAALGELTYPEPAGPGAPTED